MLRRVAGALALAVGLLAAQAAAAAEKLVFATDWRAQAEHGGFYQALAKGLYAKAGLDVTLRQGGVGMDPQQLLAAGAIEAAMGSSGFFTLNLVEAGAPVVTVAALFQKDPWMLMSHPRDDVKSIADMKGKPVMIGDPSVNTIWRWLKSRYGFEDRQIRKYTFNIAPFLVDRNAIQQGYVTSEPFTAEKNGVKPQVFLLADNGYLSYAATIMVRKELAEKRPEVVRAFVQASIEGWRDYLYGDPSPANALIKKDNPEMDDATLAYARSRMVEYGIVDSGDGIGAMSEARWDAFTKEMQQLGIYKPDLDWRKGVDFRFLPNPAAKN
ncbi:ABC transporter substrate-binding protein [Aerophototrophica crusticola]|uniref:ABC transporter substrate-binding protein n=1 Tax=Aerophototrophica crusticola TaxID=1709002 RepID=A0A858R6Y5_9PROT|nr:ABC transporter substrate-binding protein [Rhodospirillaceae bacterium B3]